VSLRRGAGDLRGADPFLRSRVQREAAERPTCSLRWLRASKYKVDFDAQPGDPPHECRCKLIPGHANYEHQCACGATLRAKRDREGRATQRTD
jgi:hypothetical protein